MTGRASGGAGYSGTSLAQKLGIKAGHQVGLVAAPDSLEMELNSPDGSRLRRTSNPPPCEFDVLLYFTTQRSELEARFQELSAAIKPDGALWVAWPKRASRVPTDVTENVLRDVGLPYGLVDNKVCAIDATWSGLRFVWRLERRPSR